MKTPSPTYSIANAETAIVETGNLKTLKDKFDQATDPTDRIGLGIHYHIMAFIDRELIRGYKKNMTMSNRQFVEGLAQGCGYGAFNIIAELASRGGGDVMEHLTESLGLYMEMQATMISKMIMESTVPDNATKQ